MARKLTRREITLAGLLAVVAVVVLYYSGGEAPTAGSGAAASGADGGAAVGTAPAIDITALDVEVPAYDPRGRNLFQYYVPPAPTPIPMPTPPPTPIPTPPPATPRPFAPPTPTGPVEPTPPTVGFTYVGNLGPKNSRIAVLELGKDMVLARVGDVVQQQFKVVGFGFESLTLGYVDERFKGRTTELKQTQGSRKR